MNATVEQDKNYFFAFESSSNPHCDAWMEMYSVKIPLAVLFA